MDNYRDAINRALDRESKSYNKGGWAWLAFGLIMQSVLALLFFRTSPFWFTVLGAPLAWWPISGGLVYLYRARRLINPNAPFRRALTTEPRLVASVERGTFRPMLTNVFNFIGSLIASAGRSDAMIYADDAQSASSACVFITLADGKKYRLSEYENHEQIIAAIRAHAPHAETSNSSQTKEQRVQEIPESGQRGLTRHALIIAGGLLVLICSVVVFAQFMNARERTRFAQRGVKATATVSDLRSYKDVDGGEKTLYVVEAGFGTREGKVVSSRAELVEKSDYEKLKAGDEVDIYYLPEPPNYFALAQTAERFRESYKPGIISISAGLCGALMLIVGIVMSRKRARHFTGATANA